MTSRRSILCVLFLSSCSLCELAYAQLKFSPAALDAKLPQSSILALMQDRMGFVWVGTREGLSRWSGKSVRTWRAVQMSEVAIPGTIVDQVLEDEFGNIWLRARRWDRHPSAVSRLIPPSYAEVTTYDELVDVYLFQNSNGSIYAASINGVYQYSARKDRFEALFPEIPDSPGVVSAAITEKGEVFVSSTDGKIARITSGSSWMDVTYIYSPDTHPSNSHLSESDVRLISLFVDSKNRVWAVGGGLAVWNPDEGRFEKTGLAELPFYRDHISDVVELANGNLLISTMFGVVEYAPEQNRAVSYYKLDLSGVRDDQQWVLSLLLDKNEDVWAGSLWGLQHAHSHGSEINLLIPHHPDGSQMTSTVAGILEHSDGSLWVSSFGGGHIKVDASLTHPETVFAPGQHDWIWMLDELADGRVVAAESHRIMISDPHGGSEDQVILPFAGDKSQFVIAVVVGPDDSIWYLTTKHIGRVANDGRRIHIQTPDKGEPTAIAIDDEFLWIGSTSELVRTRWRSPGRFESVLSNTNVTTLRSGLKHLWVGTPHGLLGFDSTTLAQDFEIAAAVTPSSFVNCIVEVQPQEIWYSTSRGITRASLTAGGTHEQLAFAADTGVGNDEFNRNACTKGRSGRLYFGGNKGVTYFSPGNIDLRGEGVPLAITGVTHRGGEKKFEHGGPIYEPIVVAPDTHTLELELSALAMPTSTGFRYVTQLDGLDEAWVDQGERDVVAYTNLAPGAYTFRARAQSSVGIWSRHEVALPVIVTPAYWQTWWFSALVLGLVVLIPISFAWLWLNRRYQVRLSAVKAIEARDQERLRISRDMHDEIGAGLTEIAILSELAQREFQDEVSASSTPTLSSKVKSIGDRTRSMLGAMSEIIWATDPRNDECDRFVAYLREYCGQFFEHVELSVTYDFPQQSINAVVPADFRRSVLLVLKEALNNIVKHARASHVLIRLSIRDGGLVLVVRDDGVGVTHQSNHGHGLKNMSDRANAIDGSLDIRTDNGTEVVLRAPFNPI